MKKIFLTLCFLSVCLFSNAQGQPKEGDVLVVNEPSGQFYNHVSFPQLNILVKRGKIASYKSVYGVKAVIDKVIDKNNTTYIVLKKKDGSKFFGFKTTVEANYTKALSSGELSLNK